MVSASIGRLLVLVWLMGVGKLGGWCVILDVLLMARADVKKKLQL